MDCIFCKIINKEIPSNVIYEDEKTFAFLDIANDFYGHTLVIPKKHCKNILDCDNDTLNAVMNTVQKISKHYINNCGFDGVNILNANGKEAEQSVFHLHIHIIPRKDNDNYHIWPKKDKENFDMNDIVKKLRLND